jgi:hypothetical protein
MEYNAIIKIITSIVVKVLGVFTEMFSRKPKRIPENVANSALSFNIVS